MARVAVAAAALAFPAGAAATTWQVTNTTDPGDPGCNPGDCSLRAAITAANTGSGSDLIDIPPGAYVLAAGVLPVNAGMQLVGTGGAGATTIDAHKASRIFLISAAAKAVLIEGLTLERGLVAGGGSAVSSKAPQSLTLTRDIFTQNTTGGAGTSGNGAVAVVPAGPATLIVTGSAFNENAAGGAGGTAVASGQGIGGGINFSPTSGTLTVSGSRFSEDTAGGSGGEGVASGQAVGGAIEATGDITATISDSSFIGDRAGGNGGAGEASGGALGGAIEFLGETAAAAVSISASTFESNEAGGNAGAGAESGEGDGGAVEVSGEGSATLVNDTFFGSNANHGAGGGLEGRIPTSLLNDTFSGNAAVNGHGGNIDISAGPDTLKNTIIVEGAATTGPNCSAVLGSLTSAGHNLEDTTPTQCDLTAAGDKVGVKALLAPLAGNGGPTETEALLKGSPAIDSGDDAGCPATDQRGVLRPAGAACDIGAFEIATPGVSTGQATAVGASSATLRGLFSNPDLAFGSVSFQYGTTTGYGAQTAAQPIGTVLQSPIAAPITGLAPGTTYHFRALITNALGGAFGADQTFKTGTAVNSPGGSTTAPTLSGLKVSPSSIRPARGKGPSFTAHARGATVSYRDSEQAHATFVVQRVLRGFVSGHACLAHRPANSHGKPHRCSRFVRVGSFAHADLAGPNRLHLTGRGAGKPLPVGRYRLRVVARNTAGQSSRAITASFVVVR
jgi:CSLREA domain-containing protein